MNIELLPIDQVDIDLLKKWQNDASVKYPLMGFRFPIQKETVKDWLENLRNDNGVKRVMFGIYVNSDAVGTVSLHNIDYVNSNADFGIYVAEKKENNKGVGTAASIMTLDFAFNAMGLNRVGLEVISNNLNAIHMYKKIGFVNEGVKRNYYFMNGSFFDVNCMSILSSEFVIETNKIKNRLIYNIDK
tara:strand:- start:1186 stop:1746 length:561 start_codon:yes stop_codon:yes gene_type:complete